jgi:hypothetical protein
MPSAEFLDHLAVEFDGCRQRQSARFIRQDLPESPDNARQCPGPEPSNPTRSGLPISLSHPPAFHPRLPSAPFHDRCRRKMCPISLLLASRLIALRSTADARSRMIRTEFTPSLHRPGSDPGMGIPTTCRRSLEEIRFDPFITSNE